MTVAKLAEKLNNLVNVKACGDKEVIVICPNGLEVEPHIKFRLKDKYDVLNHSAENIDKIVIHWE
jgi:hypothetical protein